MKITPEDLHALRNPASTLPGMWERQRLLDSLAGKIEKLVGLHFAYPEETKPTERTITMLEKLMKLNLDKLLEMDEAIELSAYARSLTSEYLALDMPVPEHVVKATEALRAEIGRRSHAADMAELNRLQAEIDSYKTATEKRGEAQKRLASMQNKLGLSTAKAR